MFEPSRILRFSLVGGGGFVIDAGIVMLTLGTLGPFAGRLLSFVVVIPLTWLANRQFTFADRPSDLPLHVEFGRYVVSMLGGAAANWGAYSALMLLIPHSGFWPVAAVACGSLAGMLVNLGLAQRFIFQSRPD